MRMISKSLSLATMLAFLVLLSACSMPKKQLKKPEKNWMVAFYNVENLFDTINDPTINDEEFLPESRLNWNTEKYLHKLHQKAKVIAGMDSLELPHFIGLAEVENQAVLEDLVSEPAIAKAAYSIAHIEDDDDRGIEVAALYRADYFRLLHLQAMEITKPDSLSGKMRHILYAKGLIYGNDTLHIFVNHWASRYGGKDKTDPKRRVSADFLRHKADSLLSFNVDANIIMIGDFNDNPDDPSMTEHLKAVSPKQPVKADGLYNLAIDPFLAGEGTLYYRSWDFFDQVIVSSALLNGKSWQVDTLKVVKHPWMLFQQKNGEFRPNRTASGGRYYGGFSDHLPVVLYLAPDK